MIYSRKAQSLFQLLKKDPFEEKDVALFKRIWLDLPQKMKRVMIEVRKPGDRFRYGDDICWLLLEKEMWSLANWLLEDNPPNVEISSYKKKLIESRHFDCFSKLQENCIKFVEDLIDWCLVLDTEKAQFKHELFNDDDNQTALELCSFSLQNGEFTEVENIINFFLSSDEEKEEFKVECGRDACRFLLNDCKWELMDKIVTWCYNEEEEINSFKEFLFSCEGFSIHYRLVFFERDWENVKCFYEWFCLSPEEIIKIKKETVFTPQTFKNVYKALEYEDIEELEPCLRWCLSNEEIVNNFKVEIEKQYFSKNVDRGAKENLDYIVSELLNGLKEVEHDITNRGNAFMKDKNEKRSLVIEDGSSSAKRLRQNL